MRKLLLLFLALLFVSCKNTTEENEVVTVITASEEIAQRAFAFAQLYADSDTEYYYGGQDSLRAIRIDCSGLVIMCYKYALVDTEYSLLLSDMSASYMYENASEHIELSQMRKGDLLFMGEENSSSVSHIALFEKVEDDRVYFIDSTKKDDINGVTRRSYLANDKKIKAFGRMKLKM